MLIPDILILLFAINIKSGSTERIIDEISSNFTSNITENYSLPITSLRNDGIINEIFNVSSEYSYPNRNGLEYMRNPRLNKELAFSLEERQILGIHGLIPPNFKTQEQQMKLCKLNMDRYQQNIDKYLYLMDLRDRNEKLFYRLFIENIQEIMPIVYTPTLGKVCQNYSLFYEKPQGIFITIHDKGYIYEILKNWPEHDIKGIVVTDGEHILSFGDLGAHGMCISMGKVILYTALGGIKPHQLLPVALDLGTNNLDLLNKGDLYLGLSQKRIKGEKYDELIDEFMIAANKLYGPQLLIQFEDFGDDNAFRLLKKYQDKYSTFNGDIQGTGSVAVAGLMSALKIPGINNKLSNHRILLYGAGDVALGVAEFCVMAMLNEGTIENDARANIWLADKRGLIIKQRDDVNQERNKFVHPYEEISNLEDIVIKLKPSILIGVSAEPGAFTDNIIKMMALFYKKPIIFALSNPTSKSECTAEQAYTNSNGSTIFASGSPFAPFKLRNKTYHTGQANNAYIFPGVSLAILSAGIQHVTNDIFLNAAQILSNCVTEDDLNLGKLFPDFSKIKELSFKIAVGTVEYAYKHGLAKVHPEPEDKENFIRSQLYDYTYGRIIPHIYSWPENTY